MAKAAASRMIRKKKDTIARIPPASNPLQDPSPSTARSSATTRPSVRPRRRHGAARETRNQTAGDKSSGPEREVSLGVQKLAHACVSVVFGDRMVSLHKEHKGPFKLVRRIHNRQDEILLVDNISGSITVLGSRCYDAQSAQADFAP